MTKTKKKVETEADSTYILKIVLYIVLASFWVKFSQPIDFLIFSIGGIPVGLFIGLLVASHEKLQIDKKIEYVVLLVMSVLTYFIPSGIVL